MPIRFLLSQSAVQTPESHDRFSIVTGREAVFLKLTLQPLPVYIQSRIYQVIDADVALIEILQGLKVIGQRSL